MSTNSAELFAGFAAVQDQVWQNVSQAVGNASEKPVTFTLTGTTQLSSEELRSEFVDPLLTIQFAFAACPDCTQLILISRSSLSEWASSVKGEDIGEIDDNIVADLRDPLEGIVQGICLAIGITKNEPMVASGLIIRFQGLTLPDNFLRSTSLCRADVQISTEQFNSTGSWIVDDQTASYILGHEDLNGAHSEVSAFGASPSGLTKSQQERAMVADDMGGLDILMDIPLEISVELGRIKMLVKDVVELGTGSIIEIDKAAGEPVDVMVNGRIVARGEVVVIEDNFGVRITEILSTQERLTRLGEAA